MLFNKQFQMENWILVDLKNDIVLGSPNKNFNKDSKEKEVKFKLRLAAKLNVLVLMTLQHLLKLDLKLKLLLFYVLLPVHCELGEWGDCDVTCGGGIRSKIIAKQAQHGGNECSNVPTESCNDQPCPGKL